MGHQNIDNHEEPATTNHGIHQKNVIYNINLRTDPANVEVGKPTKIVVVVAKQAIGESITDFEIVHDKLMHLIVVSDDLSYFDHIHPHLDKADGTFAITTIFPEGGKYKLWVDATPKGGSRCLAAFYINVHGRPVHRHTVLVADEKSVIKNALEGDYRVTLKRPEKVLVGNDYDLVFNLTDGKGNPVTNLEPLMAAGGHCVIISEDIREFLHVHPLKEVDPNWRGGPEISFRTNFPKSGLYKAWGQFQHHGKVINVGFSLKVE